MDLAQICQPEEISQKILVKEMSSHKSAKTALLLFL